ncbi:exocyst complex component exo70a1 [Phtheirospermum japonicum]|uniref:Exocyst subunit Exo70 family protein n=1 Tax=Phtheirospermum japonicum TaxID=374723 RepID=A0A830CRU1_9LAMI|nr:exocyst complex component exo70a1 [Phtheirospermum japonicum]
MPRKGMRSLCFSPKIPSISSTPPSPSRFGFSPSRPTFSHSVMDRTLEMAEPVIMKWDPETTTYARVTSLFYENRREARDFIKTVNNLQKAMHFLAGESSSSSSEKLARAQNLMQIAMKRLQKEFYQILSMNRAHLDPESVSTRSSRTSTGSSSSFNDDEDDDVIRAADAQSISEAEDASFLAMADLRLIAECMISSGYAKECLKIYKIIRKSIVDEGIYRLGVEKFNSSQIHKMNWESLEMRIENWLNAVRTAVKTLFNGERILCDHVFASSDSLRESCFAEITKEGATILFSFPENVAKHTRKSPERIFRALDMYNAISNFWPEIDLIFSDESTANIKSQAVTSLIKLGEFARAALGEFETAILKDSSKSPVAGAGIHDLTTDAASYITNLADYSNILSDILADSPPPKKNRLPESYFGFSDSDESPAPAVSLKMAWLILVLLCKLDTKAKHYKDISQSYLFLANNLQYVVVKVRTSNLKYLLGDEWLAKHESKVKQFASKYERLGWGHVIDSIPSDPAAVDTHTPAEVKEIFKKFNTAFDQAYKKQAVCVVPDSKLRDHIKVSIARKILRLYREFYNANKQKVERERFSASVVRYAPEDVGHHLSDLFFGHVDSESSSSSPSPSHSRLH